MNRKGEVEFWVKSSTKRKKSARQPYYHPSSKQKLNTNKNPSDNPSPSLPKSVIYNPIHENPTAKRHYLTILARKRWLQSTLRAKLPPHRITLALSTPIQFRRHTHPLPHTSSPASACKSAQNIQLQHTTSFFVGDAILQVMNNKLSEDFANNCRVYGKMNLAAPPNCPSPHLWARIIFGQALLRSSKYCPHFKNLCLPRLLVSLLRSIPPFS